MQFTKFQAKTESVPTLGSLKSLLQPTDKVKLLINKKDATKRPIVLINGSDFVIVSAGLAGLVRERKLTIQHLVWMPVIQNDKGFFISTPGGEPEMEMGSIEKPDLSEYVAA